MEETSSENLLPGVISYSTGHQGYPLSIAEMP